MIFKNARTLEEQKTKQTHSHTYTRIRIPCKPNNNKHLAGPIRLGAPSAPLPARLMNSRDIIVYHVGVVRVRVCMLHIFNGKHKYWHAGLWQRDAFAFRKTRICRSELQQLCTNASSGPGTGLQLIKTPFAPSPPRFERACVHLQKRQFSCTCFLCCLLMTMLIDGAWIIKL